jgi:hypothetical protein
MRRHVRSPRVAIASAATGAITDGAAGSPPAPPTTYRLTFEGLPGESVSC